MFVNYFVHSRPSIGACPKGYFSYEACDILVFNTTDCVWRIPGTFNVEDQMKIKIDVDEDELLALIYFHRDAMSSARARELQEKLDVARSTAARRQARGQE